VIKRTLYFGNPAILYKRDNQLIVKLPEIEKNNELPESFRNDSVSTIPIEDIGIVILDHQQITITHSLMAALTENNAALLICDNRHLPNGLVLPMTANDTYSEKVRKQIEASEPLKKQLWKQTIICKIRNQKKVLEVFGKPYSYLEALQAKVGSGDTENVEGRASAYYWKTLFEEINAFKRDKDGVAPNQFLNYGYAVLRAIVARSLVGSGMLPLLGIHHHNKYNAFCLADDIMEPYRPYVDRIVMDICVEKNFNLSDEIDKETKVRLLSLPVIDVIIDEKSSPLMVGMQRTTASLMRCFEGSIRKISYPEL